MFYQINIERTLSKNVHGGFLNQASLRQYLFNVFVEFSKIQSSGYDMQLTADMTGLMTE